MGQLCSLLSHFTTAVAKIFWDQSIWHFPSAKASPQSSNSPPSQSHKRGCPVASALLGPGWWWRSWETRAATCRQEAGGEALVPCVKPNAELIQWLRAMETDEAQRHLEFVQLLSVTSQKVSRKIPRASSSYFLPGMETQWLLKLLPSCTMSQVWVAGPIPKMEEHRVTRSLGH